MKIEHKINNEIRAIEVRIVGDIPNSGSVVSLKEALNLAENLNVDLVEISATTPPVCKLIRYDKYLYELKKKQKEQDKKQKENSQEVKELKFGPNINEHDYNFKLKHAQTFLERGDIVKATIQFKGREIQFKENGETVLNQLSNDLQNLGQADGKPKLEGKKMILTIRPKKK